MDTLVSMVNWSVLLHIRTLYRTRRRTIHDVVMAVVLKICSIFKIIIHFKENGVTLYLGQAW